MNFPEALILHNYLCCLILTNQLEIAPSFYEPSHQEY